MWYIMCVLPDQQYIADETRRISDLKDLLPVLQNGAALSKLNANETDLTVHPGEAFGFIHRLSTNLNAVENSIARSLETELVRWTQV